MAHATMYSIRSTVYTCAATCNPMSPTLSNFFFIHPARYFPSPRGFFLSFSLSLRARLSTRPLLSLLIPDLSPHPSGTLSPLAQSPDAPPHRPGQTPAVDASGPSRIIERRDRRIDSDPRRHAAVRLVGYDTAVAQAPPQASVVDSSLLLGVFQQISPFVGCGWILSDSFSSLAVIAVLSSSAPILCLRSGLSTLFLLSVVSACL